MTEPRKARTHAEDQDVKPGELIGLLRRLKLARELAGVGPSDQDHHSPLGGAAGTAGAPPFIPSHGAGPADPGSASSTLAPVDGITPVEGQRGGRNQVRPPCRARQGSAGLAAGDNPAGVGFASDVLRSPGERPGQPFRQENHDERRLQRTLRPRGNHDRKPNVDSAAIGPCLHHNGEPCSLANRGHPPIWAHWFSCPGPDRRHLNGRRLKQPTPILQIGQGSTAQILAQDGRWGWGVVV